MSFLKTSLSMLMAAGMIGGVNAAPGGGPKASVDIFNACTLDASDPANALLIVDTTIFDSSDDNGVEPILGSKIVQAQEKPARGPFRDLGGPIEVSPADAINPIVINLCAAGLDPEARAVNAEVVVEVLNSRKGLYASRCDDNPDTPEDESRIDLEYLELCP